MGSVCTGDKIPLGICCLYGAVVCLCTLQVDSGIACRLYYIWVLLYRASTLKEVLGITFLFAIGYFSFADTWLLKIPESHAFSLFLFALTVAVATVSYLLIATLLHIAKQRNPVFFFLLAPLLFAATDAEFALLSGGGTHGLAYLPPMR